MSSASPPELDGRRAGGPRDASGAPETASSRPPAWSSAVRDVIVVAAAVVAVVLGAAVLTSVLPVEGQRLVFHTPLTIAVLVVVTGWVLWRVATRRPPAG